MRKSLYGGEPKNPCAYCAHHKRNLTVPEMRLHECLQKQCFHLKKNDHPYWKQREVMKQKRKDRKAYYDALVGR